MNFLKIPIFITLGFLGACDTANQNSIFRTTEYQSGKVVFVDAKQRAILSNEITTSVPKSDTTTHVQTITRYCAEPSPDAFSVLSSSISFAASASQAGKADISAKIASAISESGTNIGLRTQTITVLRDMMYRLCERYMNGALSADDFTIQAGRDQRIIVSVLAIEQLTGAVQPRMVVINANAEAEAVEETPPTDETTTPASKEVTASGTASGKVLLQSLPNSKDISAVATAVKEIVHMTFQTDEITLACLGQVGDPKFDRDGFCAQYLTRQKLEEKAKIDSIITNVAKSSNRSVEEIKEKYLPKPSTD